MKEPQQQTNDFNYDVSDNSEIEYRCSRLADALRELKDLLDQYAPAWYTEAHYDKATSALEFHANSEPPPSESDRPLRDVVVRS